MYNETSTVEISEDQFETARRPMDNFAIISTPLLPLANPPTCVLALYAKDKASIQKRCSLTDQKKPAI